MTAEYNALVYIPVNDFAVQEELADIGQDFPPFEPWKCHITLRHIRGVREEQLQEIAETVREVCNGLKPFELTLNGVGSFPNTDITWVGVQLHHGLMTLQLAIDFELVRKGFSRSDFPSYIPHITLGWEKKQVRYPKPLTWQVTQVATRLLDRKDMPVYINTLGGALFL